MGDALFHVANSWLQGRTLTWSGTLKASLWGGALGGLASGLTPEVAGRGRFNPWTSPLTFGPKALQLYSEGLTGVALGTWKSALIGGGRCACQNR